jgi:N utilization substance protein A
MNPDPADIEQIWTLLRRHVPEVTCGVLRILGISRERGTRTSLVVGSNDPRIDSVGNVVGRKGDRAKQILRELPEEKIDVIRWEESTERFISNLLAPLRVAESSFDDGTREAKVRLVRDSDSYMPDLAVRSKLLADLTGWKLHVDMDDEA